MSNIWLQRKLKLIRVINQITETDYDDITLSIVLNLLWTLEDEERDYLIETLKTMITAEFDDEQYSKSFLEQLDLICTIPVMPHDTTEIASRVQPKEVMKHPSVFNDENDMPLFEDADDDDEIEDSDSEVDEPVKPKAFTVKHSAFVFLISFALLIGLLSRQREGFSWQPVLDVIPHWAYFWYELFFVVGVLLVVGYLIRGLAAKLAEHLTTFGYLISFLPFLWVLKGFTLMSGAALYFHGLVMVISIACLSRILGYLTIR